MQMTKDKVKAMIAELLAIIKASDFENKYNMIVSRENAIFDDTNFSVKLSASFINENGQVMNREATNYKRYQLVHDLPKLGTTFVYNRKIYTTIGLKTRSVNKPVICNCQGKEYLFATEAIKALCK
jgi:hypothetical protein